MPCPAPPAAEQQRRAEPLESAEPLEPVEPPEPQLDTDLPEHVRADVLKPFTGDLEEIIKRRVIRLGVTFKGHAPSPVDSHRWLVQVVALGKLRLARLIPNASSEGVRYVRCSV